MGRETISKSRVSPKNVKSRGNLKGICLLMFLIGCTSMSTQLFAQKKTVYVIPETAKIFYNGHEIGNGSYEIKFSRNEDFVMLKFEEPGYITRTLKLFKNNPKKESRIFISDRNTQNHNTKRRHQLSAHYSMLSHPNRIQTLTKNKRNFYGNKD
jgi:hypothetical protein